MHYGLLCLLKFFAVKNCICLLKIINYICQNRLVVPTNLVRMNLFRHHLIKFNLCKRNEGLFLTLSLTYGNMQLTLTYRNMAYKDVFTAKGLTLILKHPARESFKLASTNDRRGSWSPWGW